MRQIKWTLLTKLHHYNQTNNLDNFINDLELEEINSQLRLAEVQKNKLLKNIHKEFEYYLKLVRNLIFNSVEKGVYCLCSDLSITDIQLNERKLCKLLESEISLLINSQLPLITIEQLKINNTENKISQDFNSNRLIELAEFKNQKKDTFKFEDDSISLEPTQFYISNNISTTYDYYQSLNNDLLSSVDLDYRDDYKNTTNIDHLEKTDLEKKIVNSFLELIEKNTDNYRDSQYLNNSSKNISSIHENFNCFELIDDSLTDLLLNLSYKINEELFESKLINKIISEDTFKFLVKKDFMIKHPHPFVINLELNNGQSFVDEAKLTSICLFNITTVELEFKNLNLSIHRNKINEIKNQFQLLIKKEKYWRQKKINLNKIEI